MGRCYRAFHLYGIGRFWACTHWSFLLATWRGTISGDLHARKVTHEGLVVVCDCVQGSRGSSGLFEHVGEREAAGEQTLGQPAMDRTIASDIVFYDGGKVYQVPWLSGGPVVMPRYGAVVVSSRAAPLVSLCVLLGSPC